MLPSSSSQDLTGSPTHRACGRQKRFTAGRQAAHPAAAPHGAPLRPGGRELCPSPGSSPPSPAKAVPLQRCRRGDTPRARPSSAPSASPAEPRCPAQAAPGARHRAAAAAGRGRGGGGVGGRARPRPARAPCRAARPSPAASQPRLGAEQEAAPCTVSAPSCSSLPPG